MVLRRSWNTERCLFPWWPSCRTLISNSESALELRRDVSAKKAGAASPNSQPLPYVRTAWTGIAPDQWPASILALPWELEADDRTLRQRYLQLRTSLIPSVFLS